MDSSHGAGEGPTAPDATISDLKDCASAAQDRLKEASYAIQFDVEVKEGGNVGRVKLRDSFPGDRGLESCMARALEGMPVPMFIVTRMLGPQAISTESRGLMGQPVPAAAAGAAGLAPIFLVVAGITVIVIVYLHISEETAEAARRRRNIKNKCMEWQVECLEHPDQPDWNRGTFGDRKDCGSCFGICVRENGKWPDDKCPRPN